MSTTIEWTDATWNPIRGCSLVSAGCKNCYAMKQAHRFSGPGKPYEGLTEIGPHGPLWTGKIRLVPEALEEPLHWRKPRRIFVNSMSDLFHEDVPDEFICRVFGAMLAASRQIFQVLTKRPERMQKLLRDIGFANDVAVFGNWGEPVVPWPLPNVHLGVSIEDQATADERIPILLRTPAAVRFVSYEPALGPVDLSQFIPVHAHSSFRAARMANQNLPCINWVIVGGESGPGARPCDVAWIRSIKDQCQAAGTKLFVKQLGSYVRVENAVGGLSRLRLQDKKGGDIREFPEDLRVREFPC